LCFSFNREGGKTFLPQSTQGFQREKQKLIGEDFYKDCHGRTEVMEELLKLIPCQSIFPWQKNR